ncbi:MAG: 50S ribosomal protein L13 [Chloroflexi bacterium]|nr:50S ribosomal protein L13 [Chloroflexota bacterium]
MKTFSPKASQIRREWRVVDASGQTLGRLASQIAQFLKGKHKPGYAPHLDTGDFVVVVNAEKVRVTGRKLTEKLYYRHSGYPAGLKSRSLAEVRASHPERVIEHAVRGMLPHNVLGRAMFRKLKVYAGPAHPHQAQVAGSQQRAG